MDGALGPTSELDFDPEAVREKYRQERDKRLRSDGEDQYVEAAGEFARYQDYDPYVEAGFTRPRLTDEVDVAIIGAGFSGMLAAARLKEAGVTSVRILSNAGDFGGTWYWNRYPGAQCDVDAYCYLPLLEELGYMPKEKYAFGDEIFEHCRRIGRAYNLYENTCFQTIVSEIRWDEAIKRWRIRTNHDDDMKARFVITAVGGTSHVKLPGIPGIETFQGHSFHTSRWDYGYTGGDINGNLHKLSDKRVAIIGTGATAIQVVPHLGASAKHLYVFQRTPSSVDVRGNKPTDIEWFRSQGPGWQRARRENFNDIVGGLPFEVDLVNDGWTEIGRTMKSPVVPIKDTDGADEAALRSELVDLAKMHQLRGRVDEIVKDRATAEALKAWYNRFCKRPTFNDGFLPTFNQPNVTLVDVSDTKGVERIVPNGIVTGGREYQVDCIVYSTGFEVSGPIRRRIGFEILGREGRSLYDHWADGHRTLHGHSSHGFPNWFYIGVGQNGFTANMTSMFDEQAQHISHIIRDVKARGATTVEPTAEAEGEWVKLIRQLNGASAQFLESCTPGFYNNEGRSERTGTLFGESYGPGANAFSALMEDWRQNGDLAGLKLD
jgi:cyclohexanone monooxygenase